MQTRDSLSSVYTGAFVMAFIAMLAMPFIIRAAEDMPLLFNAEPYTNARIAAMFRDKGFLDKDPLLFADRRVEFNPYHMVLAAVSIMIGIEASSIILPIIAGACSIFLFILILREFGVDLRHRYGSTVLFMLAPTAIATFTISSPHPMGVLLNLVGFLLVLSQSRLARRLGAVVIVLVPFVSVADAIAGLIMMGALALHRKRVPLALGVGIVSLAVAIAGKGWSLHLVSVADTLSDLGGHYGIGVFNIILAIIGVSVTWRRKHRLVPLYLGMAGLMVLAGFSPWVMTYLMFPLAYLGSVGFFSLKDRKWELQPIRFVSLVVCVCGVLFSAIAFMNTLSHAGPDQEYEPALLWLAHQPVQTVLTHPSRAAWVQYISGKKVLLDGKVTDHKIINDSMTIFSSRNLEETKGLLEKYNVSHIIIDKEMTDGLVWDNPEEGLLFLFRNNETFRSVYDDSEVNIWQVLQSEDHPE